MKNEVLLVVDLQPSLKFEPYYSDTIAYIKENKENFDKVLATRLLTFGREKLEFPYTELFSKYTYDCGMGFYKQLKDSFVTVIGCDTDASVLNVCFELHKYNIEFAVLQDYCFSSGGDDIHNSALDIIYRNCGDVIV